MTSRSVDRDGLEVQRVGPGAKLASDNAFAAALVTLWHRVSEAGGSIGFAPSATRPQVAVRVAEVVTNLRAGKMLGVAVFRGRALLGVGLLRPGRGLMGHTARISAVLVEPRAQGQGIGTLLVDQVLTMAADRGVDRLDLSVRAGEGLEPFFARFGFTEWGRRSGWIRVKADDARDEIFLSRTLEPPQSRGDEG